MTTFQQRFEDDFNKKFGFGVWDSRRKNGHANEGIYSSDVLKNSLSFFLSELNSIVDEMEGEKKKESSDLYEMLQEDEIFNHALTLAQNIINKKIK